MTCLTEIFLTLKNPLIRKLTNRFISLSGLSYKIHTGLSSNAFDKSVIILCCLCVCVRAGVSVSIQNHIPVYLIFHDNIQTNTYLIKLFITRDASHSKLFYLISNHLQPANCLSDQISPGRIDSVFQA